MDAIILAGGLGTRLRPVIADLPKPLAPVCGHPFLDFLFHQLQQCEGIEKIVLAVGYRAYQIVAHCEKHPPSFPLLFSFEEAPLGTGGALAHAASFTTSQTVCVLNGDSYLGFSWHAFLHAHRASKAQMTIACHEVEDVSRYGAIDFHPVTHRVECFEEKGEARGKGWINGGVYLIERELFSTLPKKEAFNLEKEGFPLLLKKPIFAYLSSGTFIDIGIEASYKEAQLLLKEISCSMS